MGIFYVKKCLTLHAHDPPSVWQIIIDHTLKWIKQGRYYVNDPVQESLDKKILAGKRPDWSRIAGVRFASLEKWSDQNESSGTMTSQPVI